MHDEDAFTKARRGKKLMDNKKRFMEKFISVYGLIIVTVDARNCHMEHGSISIETKHSVALLKN